MWSQEEGQEILTNLKLPHKPDKWATSWGWEKRSIFATQEKTKLRSQKRSKNEKATLVGCRTKLDLKRVDQGGEWVRRRNVSNWHGKMSPGK